MEKKEFVLEYIGEKQAYDQWQRAIDYVRRNRTWSMAEDAVATDLIGRHMPLPSDIRMKIADLVGEYASVNPMPEAYWLEMDEEQIFLEL